MRISKEPVHIYLNAVGAGERQGEYLLSTVFADGTPAQCRVTLDWMDDESHAVRAAAVKTNRYGFAKVLLHFPLNASEQNEHRFNLRITARDADGRVSHFDDELWEGAPKGLWISLAKSVLRPREGIEGTVHANPGARVDMDILSERGVLQHWQVRMFGGEQPFSIPANPAFHGLITLRAYDLHDQANERRWYGAGDGTVRSVLYPEDRSLTAGVRGLQASYLPGAKVNAELSLHASGGGSVPGVFGVSVFDTAVEQRAETEAEANDRWFGRGWWWLEPASVGDVTRESLNKIDSTKPIDADLDLAAESLLLNSGSEPLTIESNDDSEERNEYQQHMQSQSKPLADAILAAMPLDLPGTLEQVA